MAMEGIYSSLVYVIVWLCGGVAGAQWVCPQVCNCLPVSRFINCSSLALTSLPAQLSSDALDVDVSHNTLGSLSEDMLSGLTAIQQLDFSFNPLTSVTPHTFRSLTELRIVRMRHCGLHDVLLQTVHWGSVKSVDLADNNVESLSSLNTNAAYELILSNNDITTLTIDFLSKHTLLVNLSLAYNDLKEIVLVWGGETHGLQHLDLSHNTITRISSMSLDGFTSLLELNLAHNHLQYLPVHVFARLSALQVLSLAGNDVASLSDSLFSGCTSLVSLDLSSLGNLTMVGTAFDGLINMERLSLAHSPSLQLIVAGSLSSMPMLRHLDLSYSSVTWLTAQHVTSMPATLTLDMTGNLWSCDCQNWPLLQLLQSRLANVAVACAQPSTVQGRSVWDGRNYVNCSDVMYYDRSDSIYHRTGHLSENNVAQFSERDVVVHYKTGSFALLVCPGQHRFNRIQWSTPHKGDPYNNISSKLFHIESREGATQRNSGFVDNSSRVLVLVNGSLAIREVQRLDAGLYTCSWGNYTGNETHAIHFRLDYDVIFTVKIESMLFGAACASVFLIVGILVCFIRYVSFRCSDEERQKRQSIRQLLERIQDYKTEKMEQFSAYRTAKIGQISAYRTAKMDQLSAYRTAKMDQLFAFKTAKLGRLRTYKQMTMTSILHHMDRMREHYAAQSGKVKANCARQAHSLRHKYRHKVGRFKDYRSHQIVRLRDNYHSQMTRIHEYGSQQMDKLREQYRSQQQYIVKLMELLDIGNCIAVVDAECRRAETILFDPTLPVPLDLDGGQVDGEDCDSLKEAPGSSTDGDEYMTASIGELSLCGDVSLLAMEESGTELADDGSFGDANEENDSVPTVSGLVEGKMEADGANSCHYHADCGHKYPDKAASSLCLFNSVPESTQLSEIGCRRITYRNGSCKENSSSQLQAGKQRSCVARDPVLLEDISKQRVPKDSLMLEVYLDESERMTILRQQRHRKPSAAEPTVCVHHCIIEKEPQCTGDASVVAGDEIIATDCLETVV